MPVRYQIRLPDPAQARGSEQTLAFSAHGADAFAEQLQDALRSTALFERWRALQPEPDEVDPALGGWADLEQIAGKYRLMADLVLNHVSRQSGWFGAASASNAAYCAISQKGSISSTGSPLTSTTPAISPGAADG